MPKLNVKLLRKIKKHILEEPRRLDMTNWIERVPKRKSPCGTTACIAGWTHLLLHPLSEPGGFSDISLSEIRGALGISSLESDRLFFHIHWPNNLGLQYNAAKTAKERARIAANRIDLLIKEGR